LVIDGGFWRFGGCGITCGENLGRRLVCLDAVNCGLITLLWFHCREKSDRNMELKNIEFLIENDGNISVGRIGPVRCAASACDEDQCLATLAKREGETFMELLSRLDKAIEDAWERHIFADEING
jgi:hypothetical protein